MHILVVEDEPKIASSIQKGLKEAGYTATVAPDGEIGLTLALQHTVDLVLLDMMLPGRSGLSVCTELREQGFIAPIIMLTAKDQVDDKVRALDAGANDYLTKPFSFDELLARIRVLSRQSPHKESDKQTLHDLVLDTRAHRVWRAEKEIILTAQEYRLLAYLARHAGAVLTRTQISEHVWDLHFDSDTNVIDVYITRLRNKLDKEHALKLIQTVRGAGYKLIR